MTQELADFVRGRCRVVAVSDAYRLAPWADALVSNDTKWWRVHTEALKFAGRRFCGSGYLGCERIRPVPPFTLGVNSGLQAMRVAVDVFGARCLLLLGFDLSADRGTHFFGDHPAPLQNTRPSRFAVHRTQFTKWGAARPEIQVINCTNGSAINCFPFGDVRELLLPR